MIKPIDEIDETYYSSTVEMTKGQEKTCEVIYR